MKRHNIVIFICFALLAVSCKKVEIRNLCSVGSTLTIAPTHYVNKMTKGAVDGTTFPSDRVIMLSAYYNAEEGASSNYFTDIEFAKDGALWVSDRVWPMDGTLDFFAYSADGLTLTSKVWQTKVSNGVTFSVPDNSTIQTDILYSFATGKTYENSASGVAMNFNHAEALICFKAIAGAARNTTTNTGVTITGITLNNTKFSGTCAITSSGCTWSSLSSAKNRQLLNGSGSASLNYDVPTTQMSSSFGIGGQGILVPEQSTTSFTIYYTVHNGLDGSGNPVDNTFQYTYSPAGSWSEGKKYIYVINFSNRLITVAPTVVDWVATSESVSI